MSGFTNWRKASASQEPDHCVEYGSSDEKFGVRDTKQGHLAVQPTLVFPASAYAAFRSAVTS